MTPKTKIKKQRRPFNPERIKSSANKYLVASYDISANEPVIHHGKGSLLYDYQGREYCDFYLQSGALILGHAPRNVTLAVKRAAERGVSFGTITRPAVELAELICRKFDNVEQLVFFLSAEDGVKAAIAMARSATGKSRAIRFARKGKPRKTGRKAEDAVVLDYNDCLGLKAYVEKNEERIAAILVEPIFSAFGVEPATKEFLKLIAQLCRKHKVVFICDEIVSGFRFHCGGLQEPLGMKPDITCLGNIIGGGFPLGAVAGKKKILSSAKSLLPSDSSLLKTMNPIVMQAGLATLKSLNTSIYKTMKDRAQQWCEQVNLSLSENKYPVKIESYGSLFSLRLNEQSVKIPFEKVRESFLKKGIYWPKNDGDPCFFAGCHHPKDYQKLKESLLKIIANLCLERREK